MLRPAKLFHSFHQLRHYVQTKVTELVVAQHPPPFLLPHPTTTTAPRAYQTKPLTNGLQRQFPMINKACSSPLLGGGGSLSSWRPWMMAPTASTWHRGISLGINGGYHGLGAFRSYSSSTTTPFFQAYHSATSSTQSTVFSHLSSGIFAPLANKHLTATNNSASVSSTGRLPQQKKEKGQFPQALGGASNKYNTQHLINTSPIEMTPTAVAATTTTINNNNNNNNNDKVVTVTSTTIPATMLCTEDDLTTDIHSVTVPTTQTCYYITLDLVPASLDSILNSSSSSNSSTLSPLETSVVIDSLASSSWTPWTNDVWPTLVKWKERQQHYYDQLLAWLQPCLNRGYRIQLVGSSLRLYFPKQVVRHDQALALLDELKKTNGTDDDDVDDFLALTMVVLEEEIITVNEPLVPPLGPDYFQGIHLFLTHIDEMVDHGPAFASVASA